MFARVGPTSIMGRCQDRSETSAATSALDHTNKEWLSYSSESGRNPFITLSGGCGGVPDRRAHASPPPTQTTLLAGIRREEPGQRAPDCRAGDTVELVARQGVPHLPPGQAQRRRDLRVGPAPPAQYPHLGEVSGPDHGPRGPERGQLPLPVITRQEVSQSFRREDWPRRESARMRAPSRTRFGVPDRSAQRAV